MMGAHDVLLYRAFLFTVLIEDGCCARLPACRLALTFGVGAANEMKSLQFKSRNSWENTDAVLQKSEV